VKILFVFQYLYLLFSDDSLIALDKWVFNTEAHPLPIRGANSLHRGVKLKHQGSQDGTSERNVEGLQL